MPGFGGGQGDEGQSLDAIWSQDSKTIVFSASTNRDEAARASGYTQIFALPAAGGSTYSTVPPGSSYQCNAYSSRYDISQSITLSLSF